MRWNVVALSRIDNRAEKSIESFIWECIKNKNTVTHNNIFYLIRSRREKEGLIL